MRKAHTISTFVVVFMTAGGCVDSYLPTAITVQYNYLVVDGFLDGADTTKVRLSHTVTLTESNTPVPVLQARLSIEGEHGENFPLTEKGNGLYTIAPSEMTLSSESMYRLHITTANKLEYRSDFVTYKIAPAIDSVTWHEERAGVKISVNSHDPANATHFYKWTYGEIWKFNSLQRSKYTYNHGVFAFRANASELYYCYRQNSSVDLLIFSTTALSTDEVSDFQVLFVPENYAKLYYEYSILVKQQALTQDAYEYWLTLQKLSQNTGTIFAPLPSKVTGNFHCISNPDEDVLGYFSAGTTSEKRIVLDRSQLIGPDSSYRHGQGYDNCRYIYLPLKDVSDAAMEGNLVIDWVYDDHNQIQLGWELMPARCIDCRFNGTLTKPDFFK